MRLEAERFAEHLLAADLDSAWLEIEEYSKAGQNSLFLYDRLITPAMYHIGSLWEQDIISVADEHLATGVCDVLLSRYETTLAKKTPRRGAPKRAMLFGIQHERHILGLRMVAALFREAGWEVRFLGADLPLEYAVTNATRWKPDLIGLSLSCQPHLELLPAYTAALEALEHRPAVLVGGRLAALADLRPHVTERTIVLPDLLHVAHWLHNSTQSDADRTLWEEGIRLASS